MKYRALIRQESTGEERLSGWFPMDMSAENEDADCLDYMWGDGNYGSDCNRALFFYGEQSALADKRRWGTGAFVVPYLEREDGARLAMDDRDGCCVWISPSRTPA